MVRRKHQPQRTCIACREVKSKRDLIRVVRTPAGEIVVDPTGKANGRGAYLCRQESCYDNALKRGSLAQALKVKMSPEELVKVRASLQFELSKA